MKLTIAIVFATALLFAAVVTAQQPPHPPQSPNTPSADNVPNHPHPPKPPPDPLAHLMFPPDMILGHARELNLTDEQKRSCELKFKKQLRRFRSYSGNFRIRRSCCTRR